jgi:hypothetical protein
MGTDAAVAVVRPEPGETPRPSLTDRDPKKAASLGGPNRADGRSVVTCMTYTRFLPLLMAALFIVLFVAACGGKGGGY